METSELLREVVRNLVGKRIAADSRDAARVAVVNRTPSSITFNSIRPNRQSLGGDRHGELVEERRCFVGVFLFK